MEVREELLGEHHVGLNAEVLAAGLEALHVLHLHTGQLGQLIGLIRDQGAQGDVVVMGFLLALDHDGVNAAVGRLVSLSGEIRQFNVQHRGAVNSRIQK